MNNSNGMFVRCCDSRLSRLQAETHGDNECRGTKKDQFERETSLLSDHEEQLLSYFIWSEIARENGGLYHFRHAKLNRNVY